jgi:DNA-binding transcriptional LysR family regulator
VDTHGLATDLAVAGVGIALTHCLVTQAALQAGRLVALPLPAIPAEEGYYLAVATSQTSALQDAFVEWFERSIA